MLFNFSLTTNLPLYPAALIPLNTNGVSTSKPVTAAVVITTPQAIALADAKKGVNMFQMDSINVPVLGVVENMAYFTSPESPNNKHYLFGKEGGKNLSFDLEVPFLGEVPLIQSIREAGDIGRPASLLSLIHI